MTSRLMYFFFRRKTGRFLIYLLFAMTFFTLILNMAFDLMPQYSTRDYQVAVQYLKSDKIGFWSDIGDSDSKSLINMGAAEAAFAGYWLAPVIVSYSEPTCCQQLLVSLLQTSEVPTFDGYTIQQKLGDGLFLLERQ